MSFKRWWNRVMCVVTMTILSVTAAVAAEPCPDSISGRGAVLARLHEIGNRLALGRLCSVSESALKHFRQHAIQQVSGCLVSYQIKGTEIQDALEYARPEAHVVWKQAKDRGRLCEDVSVATQ